MRGPNCARPILCVGIVIIEQRTEFAKTSVSRLVTYTGCTYFNAMVEVYTHSEEMAGPKFSQCR
jgi:hypothetical protein